MENTLGGMMSSTFSGRNEEERMTILWSDSRMNESQDTGGRRTGTKRRPYVSMVTKQLSEVTKQNRRETLKEIS